MPPVFLVFCAIFIHTASQHAFLPSIPPWFLDCGQSSSHPHAHTHTYTHARKASKIHGLDAEQDNHTHRCDKCWQKFLEEEEQEEELGSGHDEGEASGEEGEAFSTGSESDKEV
eukprot:COSAG05_NODE_50_length_24118_cov_89.534036_12_plen_114_part_00